jgi:hypothetical protein
MVTNCFGCLDYEGQRVVVIICPGNLRGSEAEVWSVVDELGFEAIEPDQKI